MKKSDRNALLAFPGLILIGLLVAVAGSQGDSTLGENGPRRAIGWAGVNL